MLFFLAALIALAAIVLLVVNLYVQSQGTQARIQQELSQRLGTPIHIRSLSVTPWGGLTLSGITIPSISPDVASEFLDAKSFHLHVRFLSLFSHRLVIKEVSLLEPNVVWPQNQEGKWRLPGSHAPESGASPDDLTAAPPVASSPSASANASPEAVPSVASGFPPAEPELAESHPQKPQRAFVPEVRRVNVTDGNFRFLDRKGNVVASFEGVRFYSNVRNSQALRGTASMTRISLRDRFFLQDVRSPLHYDPSQELDLSKISAHSGGGDVTGRFSMEPQSRDSPFSVNVNFRSVQADEIVTQAGGAKGVIAGKLEGSFEATGKTADPNALTGKGEIYLREGQLQQYSLLTAVGQVLQIEELTQLHLQQADAKYHLSPGLVTIDELILRSPNIRLSATGTITFNGKMRLDSQLAINDKVREQLFSPIRENFQPIEEGYSAVQFQITGTVDRPKTNLVEKVVGRNLKDFVSGFLGGTKAERPKKKKSAQAPIQPSQTATVMPGEKPDALPTPSATP